MNIYFEKHMFTKDRFKKLAGLLKEEAKVFDLSSFKKRKTESYTETAIISSDGQIVLNPADYRYVVITNEEQKEALIKGDIKEAQMLGAQFYEIGSGEETKIVNEKVSAEFSQDLVAYIKNINFDEQSGENIGSNDSVDGPYTKLSKLQPFQSKI